MAHGSAEAPTALGDASAPTGHLVQRVFAAGRWVVLAYALSQAVRFGANLVLARLLFPEAFGLMAIVTAVSVGVALFLDFGIGAAIVVQKAGNQQSYLDTAWTLQVIRAAVIATAIALAAIPMAAFYGHPELRYLVPIVAASALVSGFASTKLHLASRELAVRRVMLIDLPCQVIGVSSSILLAWLMRDAAALALGGLVSACAVAIASQWLLPGQRNRWHWNPVHARTLLKFSSLAIPGSIAAFMLGEGTKMLSASILDLRMFALMSMALGLMAVVSQLSEQVSGRVLFPAYADIHRSGDHARLRAAVGRARMAQVLAVGGSAVFFALAGNDVFKLLYDTRYTAGGPIMQVLALGMLASVLSASYAGVLVATNRLGVSAALLAAHVVVTWSCIAAGQAMLGAVGVIFGYAFAGWLIYLPTAVVYRRFGLWYPKFDALVLVLAAAVVVVSFNLGSWSALLAHQR